MNYELILEEDENLKNFSKEELEDIFNTKLATLILYYEGRS